MGVAYSRATVVDRECSTAIRKKSSVGCFYLCAEGAALHRESAKERAIGAFSESDSHYRPNDLDLPPEKQGAVVKPGLLDISLKPTLGTLQAQNRIGEEGNVLSDY